jgi:hypothetical protein
MADIDPVEREKERERERETRPPAGIPPPHKQAERIIEIRDLLGKAGQICTVSAVAV